MTKSKTTVPNKPVSTSRTSKSIRPSKAKVAKAKVNAGRTTRIKSTASLSGSSPRAKNDSDLPLITRLGIEPDSTITLLGEPVNFLKTLGKLPKKLKIRKTAQGDRDLTVWFPRDATELNRRIETIAGAVANGGLWIVWPRLAEDETHTEHETDLSQDLIRKSGRANGIVESNVCTIDKTYLGVKFAKAKK